MIVALCGQAKSGKDTVAGYIESKYGFQRLAFADALKSLCSQKHNLPLTYFYNQDLKDTNINGKTPRKIMIDEAAEFRSKFGEDVFVNIIFDRIKKFPHKDYVISDMRFYNELRRVRVVGGTSWFIARPLSMKINCGLEILPEHCDSVIENDTTVVKLYETINKKMNVFLRL